MCMKILIALFVLVELYYWLWWLPRNWRSNIEARNLVGGLKTVYGKNGIFWRT